ncbi:MAG: hypothetical protein SWH54_03130 [Thermodesulfobacteriota bacterium]|nr:hypothetical protein [Thermodesulfobacteriota bacterium]
MATHKNGEQRAITDEYNAAMQNEAPYQIVKLILNDYLLRFTLSRSIFGFKNIH